MEILALYFSSYFPLLVTLLFIILSTLFFKLHLSNTKPKSHGGFKTYPFVGTLPQFIANRHRYLDWTTEILSPLPTHTSIFVRSRKIHGIMTAHPPNVEHFLKTRFENYPKGTRFISLLHDFLGSGIFNSDHHLWRVQRKTASFEFTKRSLKNFVFDNVRSEIVTRFIPLLRWASESGRVLDLQDVLERFSFDNVCKLAFDFDPGCLDENGSGQSQFMRAFEEAATLSSGRFMYALPMFWKVKKFFNVGSERRLRESIRTVHGFADKIVRTRLEEMSRGETNLYHQDLLSRFISTEEEAINSPHFLRDVVISFILAGRDSTSSGLSWFFWLLSLNPDVLMKIRSEVGEVRARAGKRVGDAYDFEELKEMNYLHGAISETMRLYPPVPVNARECLEDDIFPDGTKVKRGWFVSYNAYAMGRMESIWGKDCLEFRPERWLDGNGLYKSESPFRFSVFHAGPRICLGMEMAYIQMKSIAACVVEQFDVDVLGKEKCPEYLLSLTLRMKNGLPIKVKAIDT